MTETRTMTDESRLDPFEHRLLRELQSEFRDHRPFDQPNWLPRQARRLHARRWTAGIAAGSVAVLGVLATWGGTPAYALSRAPDGDVVVTIHSPEDAQGLEQELQGLGIEADVDYNADINVVPIASLPPRFFAPQQGGSGSLGKDLRPAPDVQVQDGDFVFILPAELIDSTAQVHVDLSKHGGAHGNSVWSVYWVDKN